MYTQKLSGGHSWCNSCELLQSSNPIFLTLKMRAQHWLLLHADCVSFCLPFEIYSCMTLDVPKESDLLNCRALTNNERAFAYFLNKIWSGKSGHNDGSILLTELFEILRVFFHFCAWWFFFFFLKAKCSLSSKEWHLPHLCDETVFVRVFLFSSLGFVIKWWHVMLITQIGCSWHSRKFERTYCLGGGGCHFKVHLPLFL